MNAAVGGSVASDVDRQAREVEPTQNDVAVLSIGTNDARRGHTPEACRRAIELVVAAWDCRWVYVRPPLIEHAAWGDAIAPAVPGTAIDTPALLASLGERAMAPDGLHLTGAAYAVLLPAIGAALVET